MKPGSGRAQTGKPRCYIQTYRVIAIETSISKRHVEDKQHRW